MNHTTRLLVVLLAFALPLGARSSAADKPVKHRILFTEYGKGPNRFVELDADGKMVWEFKPPSTTVIFQVLPNGNILFGYGGTPTGVREITSRGEAVFDYVSKRIRSSVVSAWRTETHWSLSRSLVRPWK